MCSFLHAGATVAVLVCALSSTPLRSLAEVVTLTASADSVLYQSDENGDAELANGAGNWLLIGTTNRAGERRTLLRFAADALALALPADARLEAVSLTLTVDKAGPGAQASDRAALHVLTRIWSEGPTAPASEGRGEAAAAGDSTWRFARFRDRPWQTPGGDFAAASAETALPADSDARLTFSSADAPALLDDLRAWLAAPSANHGWLLRGLTGGGGARRLASRADAERGPRLRIEFSRAGEDRNRAFADDFENGGG